MLSPSMRASKAGRRIRDRRLDHRSSFSMRSKLGAKHPAYMRGELDADRARKRGVMRHLRVCVWASHDDVV